ncbi:ABC transporter ATP-binding protein/permease [Patescibacteria group bacterium]|nr:ABC transporter ATP-binding protein/permease [Patescibacteria group bacterium]MCL5797330.1 ABC transporter ATP-binding protein/permease [Patescibacteria group bacterium]
MIKLLRFLKPYRILLALILALAVGQSVANLYLPNLMADIVNKGISTFDTDYIWRTGGLMAIVAIAGTLCAVVGIYFSSQVATGMVKVIRAEIFYRIQQFSLHEFDIVSTASLITRTSNDTVQIQQVMVMILNMLITAPITLIVGIILALNQDVGLSWILVAVMPILVIVILILLVKAVPLFSIMQVKLDKLNLILDENLTGVRVVRAFNRIKHEEQRFDEANRDVTSIAIKVNQMLATMMPVMMLLINLSSVAIIWFGSLRVTGGHLEIGAMFAFLQYAFQILFSLLMVALMFIMIPRAEASATRINEVLAMEPEINDLKEVKKADKLRGFVEFQNVTFSYHGAEKPALYNISFRASPGNVTAIIGGTGAGKSTLVNLIPRFYDVNSGRILVDGVEIRQMSQDYLREKIGFVPQKAVLFAGTVNENLRFGHENATEAEIKHAADVAQASEFITKMPEGFNSMIAQGGTNVSGGQMQRISIARALVRKPEIYVFDDTFSALDFKTDAKLRAALKGETRNATVIIVAQRVSTVIDANQIIVLDEGRVVGIGTHTKLMKTCDVYRAIVTSQLSATEIEKETV